MCKSDLFSKGQVFYTVNYQKQRPSLLSELAAFGAGFFQGLVTFGEQKTLYKVDATVYFLRNKRGKFVKTALKT